MSSHTKNKSYSTRPQSFQNSPTYMSNKRRAMPEFSPALTRSTVAPGTSPNFIKDGIHSFHALNSKNGKSQSVKKTLEWDYGNKQEFHQQYQKYYRGNDDPSAARTSYLMNKNSAKLALHFYHDRLSQKRFKNNINLQSNLVIPMEQQNQSLIATQGPVKQQQTIQDPTAGLSSSNYRNVSQYLPKRMRCSSSQARHEDFFTWGGSNKRFEGKTAYQSQNESFSVSRPAHSQSVDKLHIRGIGGNARNFSHGLFPNDSVAKIYDQHLGVNSPLRQLGKEVEQPRCKKQINPQKLEKQIVREKEEARKINLEKKRPLSALKLEFSSMLRPDITSHRKNKSIAHNITSHFPQTTKHQNVTSPKRFEISVASSTHRDNQNVSILHQMTGDLIEATFKAREEKRAASREAVMRMLNDRNAERIFKQRKDQAQLEGPQVINLSFGSGYEAVSRFMNDQKKQQENEQYHKRKQRHQQRHTMDLFNEESLGPIMHSNYGEAYDEKRKELRHQQIQKEKAEIDQVIESLQRKKEQLQKQKEIDQHKVVEYTRNEELRKQDEKYKKNEMQRHLADFLRKQAAERVKLKPELKTRQIDLGSIMSQSTRVEVDATSIKSQARTKPPLHSPKCLSNRAMQLETPRE